MATTMNDAVNRDIKHYRVRLTELPPYASDVPETPLGALGDIPVAYATFLVEAAETGESAKTTYFLHANDEYCRLLKCSKEEILAVSHLEVAGSEGPAWRKECYQAAFNGKSFNGVAYSSLVESWVCYSLAPASVRGCCTCAFIPINEQQRTQQMSIDEKTSLVISELLATLAGESDYETAMQSMLDQTARITNAERVCVFECFGSQTQVVFERCAEGLEPQLGTVSPLSGAILKAWFKSATENSVLLVPDAERLATFSPPLHTWCIESGVKSLLAAPFYSEGEVVGFLGAYNYQLDESVDINRVFSAIRSFVGARIDNRRLIESLDWAGKHDTLTGLLNRRGFSAELEKARAADPNAAIVIAIIDLNDFKQINDRFGHACGDEALCAMGRFLHEIFPDDAIVCRNGGDEFLVCLLGESADRVEEYLEVCKALDMEYEYEGIRRIMTVSIGYSCHPGESFSMRKAFTQADKALYEVKRTGKSGNRAKAAV